MSEFREMRRKRQQLSEEESIAILQKATAGTLALLGDNDYPYKVSMISVIVFLIVLSQAHLWNQAFCWNARKVRLLNMR